MGRKSFFPPRFEAGCLVFIFDYQQIWTISESSNGTVLLRIIVVVMDKDCLGSDRVPAVMGYWLFGNELHLSECLSILLPIVPLYLP